MGKACIEIPAGEHPAYPCFVGTRLVGNSTNGKFVNGARYTVKEIGTRIVLEDMTKMTLLETTPQLICKNCILAWALTYPKVQGTTETGTVMLHDLKSKHLKRCHLYVGLSRVTDGKNVYVDPE